MIILIKNEIYKLLKSKRYYAFVGIIMILIILFAVATNSVFNLNSSSGNTIDFIKPHDFPKEILGIMADFLLPIFVTLIITFFISDEFVSGTFKLPLLHGFKKWEVIMAKAITTIIVTFFILVITILFSYLVSYIFWGNKVFNHKVVVQTIKCYLSPMIAIIALIFTVITISILLRNSGIIIGVVGAILVIGSILGNLIPEANKYLLTYYLKAFVMELDKIDMFFAIIICAIYGIISFALGNEILKKLEINK